MLLPPWGSANELPMKKRVRIAGATLALGLVALAVPCWSADEAGAGAGTPAKDATPATDLVAKGRAILESNCARCHAIGMDDTSHHEEAPPFRVVVTRYPPEDLAEALAEGIVSGHPDMPEFVFQPPEIEAILAYLGTLTPTPETEPDKGAAPPGDGKMDKE
jgi:cytochrome c